jgi:poly-gamma-glutamate capsule biosynthesis protein CapA/YwtB (metallophosphatase superfamily)
MVRNLFVSVSLFVIGVTLGYVLFSTQPLRLSDSSESAEQTKASESNVLASASPPREYAEPTPETFTLLFGGDVMLGRSVNTRIQKYQDPNWPFLKVSKILNEADLSLINLESPFITGCKPTDVGMIFCAEPSSLIGLKNAGIDIANLANNHIDNQGQEGIDETAALLNSVDIAPIGLGAPYFKTVKDIKIAFLGFTDVGPNRPGIASVDENLIRQQVSSAKKESDLVIVTFHWGNEYSKESDHQVELAHLTIDAGADAVIGHHPHWVQGQETYQGKPIYYSLGNLVFDQMWSDETRKGLLVRLTFSGKKLVSEEKIPIKIFDYGQPSLIQD